MKKGRDVKKRTLITRTTLWDKSTWLVKNFDFNYSSSQYYISEIELITYLNELMSCGIDLRNLDGPMKGIISSLIICSNSMWVCTDKQNKYFFTIYCSTNFSSIVNFSLNQII